MGYNGLIRKHTETIVTLTQQLIDLDNRSDWVTNTADVRDALVQLLVAGISIDYWATSELAYVIVLLKDERSSSAWLRFARAVLIFAETEGVTANLESYQEAVEVV